MTSDLADKRSVRVIYALLIVSSLAIAAGRIANVTSREGDTAFLSANDRSRWCTIAALVEMGTYQIDPYLEIRGAKRNRRPWYTIDLVRHRGDDGQLHYYSSKPPLLPTLYAGVYWCVSRACGMWLSDHPLYLGRIILLLVNLPTLALCLLATIASIDRVARSNIAKCLLAGCVCYGTMLLPFSIALNNHLPAAASVAVVLYVFVRSFDQPLSLWWWLIAGLAGGFTAANELPALSMTVFWAGVLLMVDRRALLGYLPGVAVIAIAFFATNWIAHESLRPPYMHRGDGPVFAQIEHPSPSTESLPSDEIRTALIQAGHASPTSTIDLATSRRSNRMRVVVDQHRQFGLIQNASGGYQLAGWDDWYDYPNSYWVDGKRQGVDRGEPSRWVYLAHMTIGHHGLFSLTPIWLLAPIGWFAAAAGFMLAGRRETPDRGSAAAQTKHRLLLAAIAVSSLVCGVFYVMRPEIDRNYGGVSVCFRWMLWFAPLWLFSLVDPAELLCRSRSESQPRQAFWGQNFWGQNFWGQNFWGQSTLITLLALSIFSMSASLSSPWQSPWLYRLWVFLGWLEP